MRGPTVAAILAVVALILFVCGVFFALPDGGWAVPVLDGHRWMKLTTSSTEKPRVVCPGLRDRSSQRKTPSVW